MKIFILSTTTALVSVSCLTLTMAQNHHQQQQQLRKQQQPNYLRGNAAPVQIVEETYGLLQDQQHQKQQQQQQHQQQQQPNHLRADAAPMQIVEESYGLLQKPSQEQQQQPVHALALGAQADAFYHPHVAWDANMKQTAANGTGRPPQRYRVIQPPNNMQQQHSQQTSDLYAPPSYAALNTDTHPVQFQTGSTIQGNQNDIYSNDSINSSDNNGNNNSNSNKNNNKIIRNNNSSNGNNSNEYGSQPSVQHPQSSDFLDTLDPQSLGYKVMYYHKMGDASTQPRGVARPMPAFDAQPFQPHPMAAATPNDMRAYHNQAVVQQQQQHLQQQQKPQERSDLYAPPNAPQFQSAPGLGHTKPQADASQKMTQTQMQALPLPHPVNRQGKQARVAGDNNRGGDGDGFGNAAASASATLYPYNAEMQALAMAAGEEELFLSDPLSWMHHWLNGLYTAGAN
jgi:hypothetical protein